MSSEDPDTVRTGVSLEGEDRIPISIVTYNIRSGRSGGLELALRAMKQMNVDFGILTETKLTDGIHTRSFEGYTVVATKALSPHQGGVAIFFRESNYWQVESVKKYGPNVISCHLVTGRRRIPVVGAYIPPSDEDLITITYINKAMDDVPNGLNPLLMGDLNANLADPRDDFAAQVAAAVVSYGLDDLLLHFKQRRGKRHGYTWSQRNNGELVTARCDYILGSDRRMFTKVALRDPRLFSSDHLMVMGMLLSAPKRSNKGYLGSRKRFPLRTPKWGPKTKVNALFQKLKDAAEPPEHRKRKDRMWVSEATWKLVDERAELRRDPSHDRAYARRLTRRIRQSFKDDRKRRVEAAGAAIEAKLEANDLQGGWNIFKAWYRHAGDRPSKPSRADLRQVTSERAALYRKADLPGDNIPVIVASFDVLDAIPLEDEIAEAVKRLRSGKAPGPSGMRTDHLKEWLAAAYREKNPDTTHWDMLVELVQHAFEMGELPDELP